MTNIWSNAPLLREVPGLTWRELRARYLCGYPWRIIMGGLVGPLSAWWIGAEWVGCQGGLTWSRYFGWE